MLFIYLMYLHFICFFTADSIDSDWVSCKRAVCCGTGWLFIKFDGGCGANCSEECYTDVDAVGCSASVSFRSCLFAETATVNCFCKSTNCFCISDNSVRNSLFSAFKWIFSLKS